MKKNLAKKVTLSILVGAVLMSSGVVWAADEGIGYNYLFGIGSYGEEVIRKEREDFKSKVGRFAVMF